MYTALASARMFVYGSAIAADKGNSSNKDFASVFLYAGEQGT